MQFCASKKHYNLTIFCPGIKLADLRIVIGNGNTDVHVSGRSVIGPTSYSIDRKFVLPRDAVLDLASAEHEDGVLHIKLPKRPPKTTIIQVTDAVSMRPASEASKSPSSGTPDEKMHPEVVARPVPVKEDQAASALLTECAPSLANVQAPAEECDEIDASKEAEWDTVPDATDTQ